MRTRGPESEVAGAYDRWAEAYTELLGEPGSLAPEDTELVLRWAGARVGPVVNAGCGPGTWAGLLADRVGQAVVGLDLSERFVAISHDRHPGLPFLRGSLTALPFRTGAVDGVLAWYTLIHTPPSHLPRQLRELRRVLGGSGSLLVRFFDGAPGSAFDHRVTTAYAWSGDALGALLERAGFVVQEQHRRQDAGHRPHGALVAAAVGAP